MVQIHAFLNLKFPKQKINPCNINSGGVIFLEKEPLLKTLLLDSVSDAIFLHDLAGNFIYFNKSAHQSLGYTYDELNLKTLQELDAPEHKKLIMRRINDMQQHGETIFESGHLRKDGTVMPVEVHAHMIKIDNKDFILSVARDISERRHAEKESARASALSSIIDAVPDAIVVTDIKGIILQYNWALTENYEFNEEIIGKKISKLFFPEDQQKFIVFLESCIDEGCFHNMDILHKCKNNQEVASLVSGVLLRDEEGKPLNIIITIKDITTIKQAEQRTLESKEFIENIFESMKDGFSVLNAAGEHLNVNNALCIMTGFSKEELLGTGLPHLYWPEEEYYNIEKALNGTFHQQNQDYELIFKKKSGERFPVLVSPSHFKQGDEVVYFATVKDITQRKHMEESLRESEERFRQIAESINEVFYIHERANNRFIYVSPAFEKIWEIPCSELYNDPQAYFYPVHPDDRDQLEVLINDELENEVFINTEYRIITPNGNIKWIWARNFPLRDDNGVVYRVVGIAEDITQQKNAEIKLQRSLNEKEILLKDIHHRVKNNLQIISSLLNLQSTYIKNQEDKELFLESQSRTRSMALIHERLYQSSDLKKIEFGEYIRSLVRDLYQTYQAGLNKIKLNLDVEENYLDIYHAIPLGLIITELVSNCMKYAFPNSKPGNINIKFRKDEGKYSLIVEDDGVGLPPDMDLETTDTLGMQLVKNLSKQIDAEINLDTNKGTVFKITF